MLSEQEVPEWMTDMNQPDCGGGFYKRGDMFALQHTHRTHETLYVGYDDLGRSQSSVRVRDGFGYKLAKDLGWSYLAVQIFSENWFRVPELHAALSDLASRGFFSRYDRVIFTGVSMGGFAACAFAPLAPGCTVIALSPQSTLAISLAAWDKRFPNGSGQDWSGLFSDAAEGVQAAGRAWIFYDPKYQVDRRHAARIVGPHVLHLHARYTGHGVTSYLKQLGILKEVVIKCADGTMTKAHFYQLYRKGRETRRMLKQVMAHTLKRGKAEHMNLLGRVLMAKGRRGMGLDMKRAAALLHAKS